jgi:uncharacterized membrane protein YoaT (DUF817 family)
MYASVGSYIARAWRLFDFRFTRHPPLWALSLLSIGIYLNFYAHHYVFDLRLALFVAATGGCRCCSAYFSCPSSSGSPRMSGPSPGPGFIQAR